MKKKIKKSPFQTKTLKFGGKKIVAYVVDGWPDEKTAKAMLIRGN